MERVRGRETERDGEGEREREREREREFCQLQLCFRATVRGAGCLSPGHLLPVHHCSYDSLTA